MDRLSACLALSALNLELQIECNYLHSPSPPLLPLQFVFTLYDLHWATVQQFDKRRHRLSRQETGADLGLEWGPGATTMSASVRVWLLCAPLNFAFNWFVNTNVCRVGFLALSRLARPTPAAAAAATSGLSFGPTTRGLNTRVMQHKFATLAGKLKVASGATQRKSWCGATSKTALTTPSETIINHSAPTDLSRTDQDGHYIWKGPSSISCKLQAHCVASCPRFGRGRASCPAGLHSPDLSICHWHWACCVGEGAYFKFCTAQKLHAQWYD